jgi:hypothetical protein
MAQSETDPFSELRERIRSTADAAERLSFEAAAGDSGDPRERARRADETTHEAQALVALVHLLRDLLPDDLRQQVVDLVRQVLKLLRAVIDWYLSRLEPGPRDRHPGPVVEDIPLDEI